MSNSDNNPITVALRDVFGPLVQLTAKLPAPLAYGAAIVLALLVVALLGVVIPTNLIWLLAVVVLASLAAFVYSDRDARRRREGATEGDSSTEEHPTGSQPLNTVRFERKIEDQLVEITELHDRYDQERGEIIPLADLLSALRPLFNRKTFYEPFPECVDENWQDRLCAAVQIEYLLKEQLRFVKEAASYSRDAQRLRAYERVRQELGSYALDMTGLFQPSPQVADIEQQFLAGDLDGARLDLRKKAVHPRNVISETTIDACEQHRKNILQEVQKWPAIPTEDGEDSQSSSDPDSGHNAIQNPEAYVHTSATSRQLGEQAKDYQQQYIASKPYNRFVGREAELDEVMNALREPKRKPIVAIFGLGGIGKTRLAQEAVALSLKEKTFECSVWFSAKPENLEGDRTSQSEIHEYSFDKLLRDIARQCMPTETTQEPADLKQPPDTAQMTPAQLRVEVKKLLNDKRVLVVLDNLETVQDSEQLIASIFEIMGQSKLLVTSRHRLKHDRLYNITLHGFSEDDGVAFLRAESRERGIEDVRRADRSRLVEINRATGGLPQAMVVVVGLMSRQPMEIVLNRLREVKGQAKELYRFIYRYSWEMLDIKARKVLVDMSIFPPLTGGTVEDVESISQVAGPDFWTAMDQLVTMSLVDKIGGIGEERFALHPVTLNFIRSDITKEWAEEGDDDEAADEGNEPL